MDSSRKATMADFRQLGREHGAEFARLALEHASGDGWVEAPMGNELRAAGSTDMAYSLGEFLCAGARVPFEWGRADCTMWACSWVKAASGVDPAAAFRGRYSTELGAARHIAKAGSLEAATRRAMATAGLPETDAPKDGDVGLVTTFAGPAMAIRVGPGWAVKGNRKIVVGPFPTLRAWRVVHHA